MNGKRNSPKLIIWQRQPFLGQGFRDQDVPVHIACHTRPSRNEIRQYA